jgi:hypothetical protein
MRKTTIAGAVIFTLLFSLTSSAQVYNTAQKLKIGAYHLGIAPILLVNGDVSPGIFFLGGVGVTHSLDLYINGRFTEHDPYFGVDLQWALLKSAPFLSLITGAHVGHNLSVDATIDLTFPVGNTVVVYGGLDVNIEFPHNNVSDGNTASQHGDVIVPAWLFFGPRIYIRKSVALFMEIDLGITQYAPSIFGLGLGFYL